jgi:hypothetical protein
MRTWHERLVMLLTLSFVALVAAQTGSATAVAISLAITAIVLLKHASVVIARREIAVGARAHAHRESLSEMTAPQHPDTAGRPRTRAPSQVAPAL